MQNAVDAVTARTIAGVVHSPRITVRLASADGETPAKLEITDTGAGLTLDEIHKFLSVIG